MSLEGERYRIRSLTALDVDEKYLSWFQNPEVMRFVAPWMRYSPQQHAAVIKGADNETKFMLGIFRRDSDRFIGWLRAQVYPIHERAYSTLVIGYEDEWGQGAMLDVHRCWRLFAFDNLAISKVTFSVYGQHEAMLKKLPQIPGVVSEGVSRRHEKLPGVGFQDVLRFAIFRNPPGA